jgi:hypothetical protein
VEYRECPTEEVSILSDQCESDPCKPERISDVFSRIQEESRVYIMDVNPNANHNAIRQDTYGCGSPHPICLARLQHGPKGWELIQCGQRAAKHPLQSTVAGASGG